MSLPTGRDLERLLRLRTTWRREYLTALACLLLRSDTVEVSGSALGGEASTQSRHLRDRTFKLFFSGNGEL